jgi:hypothetical protein
MTIDEFYAPEIAFEPTAAQILKAAGFQVVSDFLPIDPLTGNPNIKGVPDAATFVEFEMGDVSDDPRVFRADAGLDGALASEPAGFEGVLKITHRVPVDDQPVPPGEHPGCYRRLCLQRGRIRALFRDTARPFKDLIPAYDIQSIALIQPDRRIDGDRSANQATERFRIRWIPAYGEYPVG